MKSHLEPFPPFPARKQETFNDIWLRQRILKTISNLWINPLFGTRTHYNSNENNACLPRLRPELPKTVGLVDREESYARKFKYLYNTATHRACWWPCVCFGVNAASLRMGRRLITRRFRNSRMDLSMVYFPPLSRLVGLANIWPSSRHLLGWLKEKVCVLYEGSEKELCDLVVYASKNQSAMVLDRNPLAAVLYQLERLSSAKV